MLAWGDAVGGRLWRPPPGACDVRHAGAVPVLLDPVPLAARRLLRGAVLEVARSERRRRVAPALHVGTPGGPASTVVEDPIWDHALRTEIVGAVLRARHDPSWVWVTRSGPLTMQDVDAAWLAPTMAAAQERGTDPAYVVVTRQGWFDPRSGLRREWRRIRSR